MADDAAIVLPTEVCGKRGGDKTPSGRTPMKQLDWSLVPSLGWRQDAGGRCHQSLAPTSGEEEEVSRRQQTMSTLSPSEGQIPLKSPASGAD